MQQKSRSTGRIASCSFSPGSSNTEKRRNKKKHIKKNKKNNQTSFQLLGPRLALFAEVIALQGPGKRDKYLSLSPPHNTHMLVIADGACLPADATGTN